ncbi:MULTISPECIES: D-Ala-D-Ala carboxypeptidase family metallohydrolase [Actinoalloteichus]|uniref:Peptidoglycan binding protein n=1 Tax=Actinoalloteichus fjordicus TaxID=1612552 RepID=A0AAC9PUH7_9PSEU|nr:MULTISPECIES: D-Ala-D-Ala carboxypeptidase family metallohydrolase [Actinoalloteichus]APU17105.1 putative peptidoglycan binding protein [Actinoalloteichus fjordicus]APU23187.1 putative peptidoglycan binding protein [Actinoalloteichus sp. GBA129-24]
MLRLLGRMSVLLAALVMTMGTVSVVSAPEAHAYNWTRTLRQGDSGADVRELQIRVAGWAAASASRTALTVDGDFGPATQGAVRRFQGAYGLGIDGVVGPATQAQLNWLEASDGSTRHFNFSEFHSRDGAAFNNGRVGASTVRENVRRLMYKLEAVRKKSGDRAITINSGFRSVSHNAAVGGASNSQHMYGIAADIVISGRSVSQTIGYGQTSGFSGIIRYSTFTHVDSRAEYSYGSSAWYWAI